MIFRKANPNDLKNMNELWNEVVKEEYFLKPMTYEEFSDKLLTNPDFDYDSVTVVYENEKLIAFSIGYLRKKYIDNPDVAGIVNMIMVKKEYRKQGIGSKLLKDLETYFKSMAEIRLLQHTFYHHVIHGIFLILIITITLVLQVLDLILMNTSSYYIGDMKHMHIKMPSI